MRGDDWGKQTEKKAASGEVKSLSVTLSENSEKNLSRWRNQENLAVSHIIEALVRYFFAMNAYQRRIFIQEWFRGKG